MGAETLIREAHDIRRAAFGESHPDVTDSLEDLAGLMEQMGRINDARKAEQRALDIRTKL